MSNKIKVLIILPSMESGGVESYCVNLANFLINNNTEVGILSSGGMALYRINRKAKIFTYDCLKSKNIFRIRFTASKIISKVIQEFTPDICHIMSRASAWSFDYAIKKIKNNIPKIVYTVHGAHSISGFLKKQYNSIIYKNKDAIIAVSDYVKDYLMKNYKNVDKSKISIIYPVYNNELFNKDSIPANRMIKMSTELNINDNFSKVFLVAGRISKSKGHEFLIKSICNLKSDNFLFIFCGKVQNEKYLKKINKMIKDNNLVSKITITDSVSDLPALYMLVDYVICPSVKPETFGLVPVEASAMGKVCIVTNEGFLSKHIDEGKTGWIVEKNDILKMTSIIENAINLPQEEYMEMSKKAIKKIQNNDNYFNGNEKCLDLYLNLLNNEPSKN